MEEEEEENHHQQSKRKRNNEEMNTEAETLKKQPKTDTPSVVGPTKPADIQTKKKKKGTTTALGGGFSRLLGLFSCSSTISTALLAETS